jgi:PKD domain
LIFNTPGTFVVTFTAIDERGSVSSNAVTITVTSRRILIAIITSPASDTVIAAGETILFEGAVSGGNDDIIYAWSFGGGSLDSTARNPGAVGFDVPGSYTVTLMAMDADGDSSRDTGTVTVQGNDSEPVARIVSPISDMCILVGQAVTFQGVVTGGDGGMAFTRNFGRGAPNSSEQNPGSVMFSATGKYVAILTARDEDGDTSSDSGMVTVEEDTTPVAMIKSPASDATVDAGQTVLFQGGFGWKWEYVLPVVIRQGGRGIVIERSGFDSVRKRWHLYRHLQHNR